MRQRQRIVVRAVPGWEVIDNPDGPLTLVRGADECGAFQASHAEYKGGVVPDPSDEDLIALASECAGKAGAIVAVTGSASCSFGRYGTATGRTETCSHFQVWYLSNGRDFIIATYIAAEVPPTQEVREAAEMALTLTLRSRPAWWKFWVS